MSTKNTILIAEDAEINREILVEIFKEQYEVAEAENGQEAIDYIESHTDNIACLLLDLIMPVKTGFDVMQYMADNKLTNSFPVILITGDNSKETEEIGYNYKVSDIIYKPFVTNVIMRRVKNVIDLYEHINNTEKIVADQTKKLEEYAKSLKETNELIIDALGKIVEYKDFESKEHVTRIKKFTRIMLKYAAKLYPELELTQDKQNTIVCATALHDIGKIGLPDSILLKHGELTPSEREIMRSHTTIGCEILEYFSGMNDKEFYNCCYDICRYHHERWDGNGYPEHISGDKIPFSAQIVALVNAYDKLVTRHAYRNPYTHETAVKAIFDGESGVFSPKALECFQLAQEDFRQLVEFSDSISFV